MNFLSSILDNVNHNFVLGILKKWECIFHNLWDVLQTYFDYVRWESQKFIELYKNCGGKAGTLRVK